MSRYTTEVRYICEEATGLKESVGYTSVNDVIQEARNSIFDFDYPLWDESYKPTLESKILRHYYTREIGCETVGLWKLRLWTKLNEIMPYYNKLYETSVLNFNPLYDVDYTRTGDKDGSGNKLGGEEVRTSDSKTIAGTKNETEDNARETSGEGSNTTTETGSSSGSSHSVDLYADTPQGAIITTSDTTDPVTGERVTVQYMSEARTIDENDSKQYEKTGNGSNEFSENVSEDKSKVTTYNETQNGSENRTKNENQSYSDTLSYAEHVVGKKGGITYMKMIQELRDILINIDMMIIDELKDLFMLVW